MHHGESGEEVTQLQEKLRGAGYDVGAIDGHFGHATEQAVMAFQQAAGLHVDGAAGPHTLQALEHWRPQLDVVSCELHSSCEWVEFVVGNRGVAAAAEGAFTSWVTVQPRGSGSGVFGQSDPLPAVPAHGQVTAYTQLPTTIEDGDYDIHVGILDAVTRDWVTTQPHIVAVSVHQHRFSARAGR